MLATAMILQIFNLHFADTDYKLSIKQTLTIKPKDFFIHAKLRKGIDTVYLESMLNGRTSTPELSSATTAQREESHRSDRPQMTIFFGSNMGTCESLAQTAARSAAHHGFSAIVKSLDDATESLPEGQPVLIITASYEGEPPDNAQRFIAWLQGPNVPDLSRVQYAVFGCGNRDWKETFQRIPTLTDTVLEKNHAKRLTPRAPADAANNDIFNDFERWEDQTFWPAVKAKFRTKEASHYPEQLQIELSTTLRSSHLRADVKEAVVVRHENLTSGSGVDKLHIEFKLPTDMTYRAGDYLAVLPTNHTATVGRVFKRFGLPWDASITVKPGETYLPTQTPLSLSDVLSAYVELSQTATKRVSRQDIISFVCNAYRANRTSTYLSGAPPMTPPKMHWPVSETNTTIKRSKTCT